MERALLPHNPKHYENKRETRCQVYSNQIDKFGSSFIEGFANPLFYAFSALLQKKIL